MIAPPIAGEQSPVISGETQKDIKERHICHGATSEACHVPLSNFRDRDFNPLPHTKAATEHFGELAAHGEVHFWNVEGDSLSAKIAVDE